MGTSFRIADPHVPEEVRRIAELCGELGYPSEPHQVALRLERVAAASGEELLVAVSAHGVAGWIHVQALGSVVDEPLALIAGLVVAEAARGRGLGRGLVREAERWARERGLSRMVVRSRDVRTEAHRFYELLGYELQKTQRVFRKSLAIADENVAR